MTHRVPKAIQSQLDAASRIERQLFHDAEMHPKRGPAPHLSYEGIATLEADSHTALTDQIERVGRLVGPTVRGNKRIGKALLYTDLLSHFTKLRRMGITLPRNKSLSARACMHGLGEILRRHGCTAYSDEVLVRNGVKRQQVANKMDRIFARVAAIV